MIDQTPPTCERCGKPATNLQADGRWLCLPCDIAESDDAGEELAFWLSRS